MRFTDARTGSTTRRLICAAALTVLAMTGAPTVAHAAPAPAPPAVPKVDLTTVNSVGSLVPALLGSLATKGPDGKVNTDLIREATAMSTAPGMPPQLGAVWTQIARFLEGTATPTQVAKVADTNNKSADPTIPTGPNAPKIQQFLYPTIGLGCIPGGGSVGKALVTAGPQEAPAPGPKRGQAGFVYTSLGTGPAVNNLRAPLTAIWINIDTGRSGQLSLKRNERINATNGPGTFTGIATTGRGRVLAAIYGTVTTTIKKAPVACTIFPTVGLAFI
ncbi:hypothetical protein [Williamsia sp. CHRR-6]|uniref:Rv1157c family protein n=1 Tax=Williamsia sp. CHRR-6 TaxID=2835871 RepID=UPI0035B273EE